MTRIITILSIILLTVFTASGQSLRNASGTDPVDRIVKLYPNPATSYITFDLQKNNIKGLSIQIFKFLGVKVYEGQNLAQKVTVDLADFNRGLYIYNLIDQTGKIIESGKFQVSR